MVKVVVVNGRPGSGKTTFEDFCISILGHNNAFKISTVDRIKEAAKVLGWDGTKTKRNRKFLSDLKDLASKWDDVPFRTISDFVRHIQNELERYGVEETHTAVVFVDSREPEEIQRFKRLGAITLLVRNSKAELEEVSNHADSNVFDCEYDYCICNDGTLEDLMEEAKKFCEGVLR